MWRVVLSGAVPTRRRRRRRRVRPRRGFISAHRRCSPSTSLASHTMPLARPALSRSQESTPLTARAHLALVHLLDPPPQPAPFRRTALVPAAPPSSMPTRSRATSTASPGPAHRPRSTSRTRTSRSALSTRSTRSRQTTCRASSRLQQRPSRPGRMCVQSRALTLLWLGAELTLPLLATLAPSSSSLILVLLATDVGRRAPCHLPQGRAGLQGPPARVCPDRGGGDDLDGQLGRLRRDARHRVVRPSPSLS